MLMLDARRQLLVGNLHLAQEDLARVERNAAQRGVANGARLLPDFLEHEVLVAALFRLDRIPLDARDRALDRLAVEVGQLDAVARQDGHVAVGQKVDIAGVVQNAGHVGGDKRLALAHADDHRRSGACGDNLVRLGGRETPSANAPVSRFTARPHGRFQQIGGALGLRRPSAPVQSGGR